MICYLDKTFCASPGCKNKCGRKMTKEETRILETLSYPSNVVCWADFCDKNGELMEEIK